MRQPRLLHLGGQVAALDQLGDEIAPTLRGGADIVDRHNMGMVQTGQDTSLGQVSLGMVGPKDAFRVWHLDRHVLAVRDATALPHDPHPASADLLE